MTVVLVDNHDSYTLNLAHLIARCTGKMPVIVPNDVGLDVVDAIAPAAILLSPGAGRPGVTRDLGVCARILHDRPAIPLLGVCLGHQALVWARGGTIDRIAPRHGRTSLIRHADRGLFQGLPQGFPVVRYHSLGVVGPLPPGLEAHAWSEDDGVVQAVAEAGSRRFGVQFHPESVASSFGAELVARFLEIAEIPKVIPSRSARPSGPPPPRARVHTHRLEGALDAASIFSALFQGRPGAFWLDSAGRQGRGPSRFSFLGAADGPEGRVLTWTGRDGGRLYRPNRNPAPVPDLATAIRDGLTEMGADVDVPFDFVGGWVGWIGYEARAAFPGWPGSAGAGEMPDVHLAWIDRLIVLDHDEGATWLVALARRGGGDAARAWFGAATSRLQALPPAPQPSEPPPGVLQPAWPAARWLQAIQAAQEHIRAGETYEVNVTHTLVGPALPDPFGAYLRLRAQNPAPYGAFISSSSGAILGSSPEQLVKIDRRRHATARPIKGTAPRSADPGLDATLARALASSEKERAENLMITDLLRHDLGRVAEPDGVMVPELFAVEPFATVHHLVSTIHARLRPEVDAVDVAISVFPPGSMTGAPKERTVEVIQALESGPRGVYSGALGWFSVNGCADLAVVIRTAVATAQRTTVGVGGAITALSDPEAEVREALLKAEALERALWAPSAGAEGVARR